MSYALSPPSSSRRSGLLTVVIGLHAGALLLALAAKTVAPQIMEMPLIVDLLPAPQIEAPPEAKPLPMAKPEPVVRKPLPQPKTPTPVLETTASTAPADNAPVAPPLMKVGPVSATPPVAAARPPVVVASFTAVAAWPLPVAESVMLIVRLAPVVVLTILRPVVVEPR